MFDMDVSHISGLPGPLLRNRPSKSEMISQVCNPLALKIAKTMEFWLF